MFSLSGAEMAANMGDLTKSVIAKVKSATTVDELNGWIWKAADLLAKSSFEEYHSGFSEIDDEAVSAEETTQLVSVLRDALNRNSDPRFVSQILGALGRARDHSLKPLYVDYLARHLKQLKDNNGIVYAALLALNDIDEPVYEHDASGRSSQSVIDVEKNIRQAHRYLGLHGIVIPW